MNIEAKNSSDICEAEASDFLSLLIHLPTNVIKSIEAWNKERKTRHRDRMAIEYLRKLGDNNLRDIGITSDDVKWAQRLPSNQSATSKLQRIARRKV